MTDREHHTPIEGPLESSPEWQEARVWTPGTIPRIGASDAAAACGRSSYRTALDLYLTQRGELQRTFDEASEKRMRRGRRLQSVILQEYGTEMDVEVLEPLRQYIHPKYQFCTATPDGIAIDTKTLLPIRLVEAKASSPHMYSVDPSDSKYGAEGTDWVPDDILFQAQQQMAVMDMDQCDVVVMFGVFLMRVYPVYRNDDLIDAIVVAEEELADRIIDGNPPEPNWSHARTRALISAVHGLRADSVKTLSPEDLTTWLTFQALGEEVKGLERQRDECRNRILWSIGECEIGRFPMGTKELRRVVVTDTIVTEQDVAELAQKVGQVKRKGHERLVERKVPKS